MTLYLLSLHQPESRTVGRQFGTAAEIMQISRYKIRSLSAARIKMGGKRRRIHIYSHKHTLIIALALIYALFILKQDTPEAAVIQCLAFDLCRSQL